MNIELYPKTLRGTINVPSSLNHTIINIILSSLCSTSTTIVNPNYSEETYLTIDALKKVGTRFKKDQDKLIIIPSKEWKEPLEPIECGINDSIILLLMSLISYKIGKVSFHGTPEVIDEIENHSKSSSSQNITILKTTETLNVLKIEKTNSITLSSNIKPQNILGSILFAVVTDTDFTIKINTLSYMNHISSMLKILDEYGVNYEHQIQNDFQLIIIKNDTLKSPNIIKIEGDWSIGSGLCIMGLTNERLILNNLSTESFQEEKEIINILKNNQSNMSIGTNQITIESSYLQQFNYDLASFPYLNIQLLGLASISEGTSKFNNFYLLNKYDQNKLLETLDILKDLKADIKLENNSVIINGKSTLEGGTIKNINDYKIFLMLLSILNKCIHPITILNTNILNRIDHNFILELRQLGLQLIYEI